MFFTNTNFQGLRQFCFWRPDATYKSKLRALEGWRVSCSLKNNFSRVGDCAKGVSARDERMQCPPWWGVIGLQINGFFLQKDTDKTELVGRPEVWVPQLVRAWELLEGSLVNHVDHRGLGVGTSFDVPEPWLQTARPNFSRNFKSKVHTLHFIKKGQQGFETGAVFFFRFKTKLRGNHPSISYNIVLRCLIDMTYSLLPNWSHGLNSNNHCAFWKTVVWIILTCEINRKPWS